MEVARLASKCLLGGFRHGREKVGWSRIKRSVRRRDCTLYRWKEGAELTCRGYTIEDLASNAQFEEVAYMLLTVRCQRRVSLIHITKN